MLRIIADEREKPSGVPEALRSLGVSLEYRLLDVADYLVGAYAIERSPSETLSPHSTVADSSTRLTDLGKHTRQSFSSSKAISGKRFEDHGIPGPSGGLSYPLSSTLASTRSSRRMKGRPHSS